MRCTKYRTEKIKNTKDKGPKDKDTFGAKNFWVTDVTQKDHFFWVVSDVTPGGFFFLLRFQTSLSLIALGFRRHLKKSCSPVRSIQISVFFTGQKREKKDKT